jgi:hypothetical protein
MNKIITIQYSYRLLMGFNKLALILLLLYKIRLIHMKFNFQIKLILIIKRIIPLKVKIQIKAKNMMRKMIAIQ